MPIYVYKTAAEGCPSCQEPFELMRPVDERDEVTCPRCEGELERLVALPALAFPKGPSALKNMGMARLEKRSDGTYENVSAQPGAQKHGTLESFGDSLTKGPKKIISD